MSNQLAPNATPRDLPALLEAISPPKRAIYSLVRSLIDELERVAPWDRLYYPPAEHAEFLAMVAALFETIESIPDRVEAVVAEIKVGAAGDPAIEALAGEMAFFFRGIHTSVDQDLQQLAGGLDRLRRGEALHADNRAFACEVAADLKGKYSSSAMGAASALVAEGRWHGVAIEPILFPEKAEEFERNDRLVATLREVTTTIGNLIDDVPLASLVSTWRQGHKVDQYALTPLYGLLGTLGKLMQETSRRALYSGDYHQIRQREGQLSARVNRLATLHNASWGMALPGAPDDPAALFPQIVRTATELAAVLDVDLLRQILDSSVVDRILQVVTLEKATQPRGRGRFGPTPTPEPLPTSRSLVPEDFHSLIPLLYDEDLSTFLELLLGSVCKRASLSMRGRDDTETALPAIDVVRAIALLESGADADATHPAGLPPSPSDAWSAPVDGDATLPVLDVAMFDELDAIEPLKSPATAVSSTAPPTATVDRNGAHLELLEELRTRLDHFLDRAPSRNQFELIQRLLRQRRVVPMTMVQSMHPFLFEIVGRLVPQLEADGYADDVFPRHAARLVEICRSLTRPQPTQVELREEFPPQMEELLNVLEGLKLGVDAWIHRVRGPG
ncbi:MAG: hypothetical protein AAGN46_15535 [Acidobacteriota bacterium]